MTLEVRDLRTGYLRGQTVLDGVSFTLHEGEILGVLGPNGAGKTTLARCLLGLLPQWGGDMVLDSSPLRRTVPTRRRLSSGLALVPDNRQVLGTLTVHENLRLAAKVVRAPAVELERAEDLFPVLRSRRNDLAAGLSGGQQQMLAIARGLVTRPRYLIVDEPSLGLAPSVVVELTEIFRKIASDGVGILLIEQNVGMVRALCESTLVLRNGGADLTPIAEGRMEQLIDEVYLGAGIA